MDEKYSKTLSREDDHARRVEGKSATARTGGYVDLRSRSTSYRHVRNGAIVHEQRVHMSYSTHPKQQKRKTTHTALARSPSSSLITAEKLLLVLSNNSQHFFMLSLSQPDVAYSFGLEISRLESWNIQNWTRVRNSLGWVRRRVSIERTLIFVFLACVRWYDVQLFDVCKLCGV